MNKDLEVFENRSDDWLGKEIAEERKISVWDFDEGKKIKEQHERIHQTYTETYGKGLINQGPVPQPKPKQAILILPFTIMFIAFLGMLMNENFISERSIFIVPYFMFIIFAIVVANKKKGRK